MKGSLLSLLGVIGLSAFTSCSTTNLPRISASKSKAESWVRTAITESYKRPSIVVDKADHTLKVYENGNVVRDYTIDIGRNGLGDKLYEGDALTPIGIYRIKEKLGSGSRSIFAKSGGALVLNFPTAEDIREFEQRKRKGLIAKNKTIGGAIEIHGKGSGDGKDKSAGCIRLETQQMYSFYKIIPIGSTVAIFDGNANADLMAQLVRLQYSNDKFVSR